MKAVVDTGERLTVTVPGRAHSGAAVAIETAEADRAICEVIVEHGRVVRVNVRDRNGALAVVYSEKEPVL